MTSRRPYFLGQKVTPCRHCRGVALLVFQSLACLLACGWHTADGILSASETTGTPATACSIISVHVVPPTPLESGDDPRRVTVWMGGISDLTASEASGSTLNLWAVTDRGPNGTRKTTEGKRRTLLSPTFTPVIVGMALNGLDRNSPVKDVRVTATIPLAGRSGRHLTGKPNGIGNDEPMLEEDGGHAISPDPNGVDTEGLVRLRDGTFWLAEEYRPSLLEVTADGTVVARYVPKGHALPGADMPVHDVLPAAYGSRRDNRGFEAIALSPDESRMWALLQSPLDHPVAEAGKNTGNVRLLAFDLRTKTPVSEHLYRLGDPKDPDFLRTGAPPADGKLCAMAAIDDDTLLVLEQSEEGIARLYKCSLNGVTDTLPQKTFGPEAIELEAVADLRAAGIIPIHKHLVADLAPLLPAMRTDAYGIASSRSADATRELKIEGLAILDRDRIALVNDNDFGVGVPPDSVPPRTCLWILDVPAVLQSAAFSR